VRPVVRMAGGGPALELPGAAILFDSAEGGGVRCISHAHMDHAGQAAGINVMTRETHRIFAARRVHYRRFISSPLGVRIKVQPGVSLVASNSGHMLGASMFKIEADGFTALYTGDMNTYDTILHRGAEPVESDILVIDSTYGSPVYKFPEREQVYGEIVRWVSRTLRDGEIPAFKVYSAGKAQEIIALINKTVEAPVVTSPQVFRISRVYREKYPWMSFLSVGGREGREALRDGAVYVSSWVDFTSWAGRRVRWAEATGWVLVRRLPEMEAHFALSNHSDFQGILSYVKSSNYSRVLTVYGYSGVLARHLRSSGIGAVSLDEKIRVELG
jgi:Predicted exonuclease of the beta-lactamase fold involved in RNA processing